MTEADFKNAIRDVISAGVSEPLGAKMCQNTYNELMANWNADKIVIEKAPAATPIGALDLYISDEGSVTIHIDNRMIAGAMLLGPRSMMTLNDSE